MPANSSSVNSVAPSAATQSSIWLDFDGTLKRMFGIIPGEPNIVVLDTAGQVHSVLSGKLDDQDFQLFVTRIDHVRSASRGGLRVVSQPQENVVR